MTKRVAVKLVADGSEFAQTADRDIRSLRQKFAAAGKDLAKEFPEEFSKGIKLAEQQVRGFADEFSRLSKGANLSQGLLSFDRSNINAELASAKQYLMTQQQLAAAIARVATEEGEAGVAARARIAGQTIEIQKTEEMVRAIEQEIALLNRLQGELGETVVQQGRVTAVNGQARAGMQQLSFQVADIASGFASGIPPMQIFAQQSTQVVQAVQMMSTKTTGLIGFLGGPWGLVITAAATVVGSLVMKLWDAEDAMQKAEMASSGLGDAQSVLGQMFDLTTGKIKAQTDSLILNARIMAANMRAQAAKAKLDAGNGLDNVIGSQFMGYGGQLQWMLNPGKYREKRFERESLDDIARRVKLGILSPAAAAKEARGIDFSRAGISEADFLTTLADQQTAKDMPGIADALERSVDTGKLDPMFHKDKKTRTPKGRKGPDPAKVAEAMANKLDEAYEKAVQLRGQFDAMPSDIDRANNALIDAQQLIAEAQKTLADPKATAANKKRAEDVLRVAAEAKKLAEAAPSKVLTDQLSTMQQTVDAQRLLGEGRMAEYNTMQDNVELARILGAENLAQLPAMIEKRKISQAQLDAYYQQRQELRLQTFELQRQQAEQQRLLQVVDDVQNATKQAIYDFYDGKGLGAAKNFIKSVFDIQKQVMTEKAFTFIFGDKFDKMKLKILGLDQVDEAGRQMATSMKRTIDPLEQLAIAAKNAGVALAGISPANDNSRIFNSIGGPKAGGKTLGGVDDAIVVNGKKPVAFADVAKKIFGPEFTKTLGQAFNGVFQGQAASGILRSFGLKQSSTGAAVGGAIGGAIFGPVGGFVGGALGGTIGGLFKKTPKGSATITSISEDASYTGSKKLREAVSGLAGGVQDQLSSIADALDADIGAFRVSIGQRKKKFTVDPTGAGRTKGSGVLKFDSEEEAVMAALRDALADGAIRGISAAAQRIIQSGGKDLQKAIEKAVLIESIPKLLKARTNPVAAALDDLNEKWAKTVAALKEGAATAQQYADAQKLYELERADILQAANDNLKQFINGLNFGPDSGLSLRDQSANARADLQPYLDAIAKGDIASVDRDKYLAAADSFLQISRALNGSGSGYFATVDELRKATQSLIDQSEAGSKAAEAKDPFAEITAKATQSTAAILDNQTKLLEDIRAGVFGLNGGGAVSGFIGTDRKFVNPLV